jgi:predicted amidophosphoribosyltransferase
VVGAIARQLSTALAPPRCAACASPCGPMEALCAGCERELARATPVIDAGPPGVALAVAVSSFDGVAREIAHGLKFGRRLGLAAVAAGAMLRACPEGDLEGAAVPVPAAPWRWRWRGFDPAEEIALELARLGGLPYRPCLRRGHGPRQVGRARRARLSDPPRIQARSSVPRRALVIDDVHTTGATLAACASALRRAGSGRVVALTLARAL